MEFIEMMHEVYIHELRGHFRVSLKMNERCAAIACGMLAAITSEVAVKQIS
jgi:hypothetical protein